MRPAAPVFLAVLLALAGGGLAAAKIEPAPATYVDDRANLLDAASQRSLVGLLQELEQKTTARIIVVTVGTTGGQDVHQYAFERADAWTFGPKRTSASVLVVVAVEDRRYRIEVGYDWEGVVPDALADRVARTFLVPQFQAGRPSRGVFETAAMLAKIIADDRGVALGGMPDLQTMDRPGPPPAALGPIVAVIVLSALSALSGLSAMGRGRRRSGLFWGMVLGSMMGGRGGRYGGRFGGFGGGGFGSFGGGGGGGFGGGGASGGW
ncbi:MAG: TPM domain-containing protein [Planctomycetes bacterium]|nr:TPM domain-containing protein [Planctomycetota bacterium]